jgi:biotin transport system substrate-specific component
MQTATLPRQENAIFATLCATSLIMLGSFLKIPFYPISFTLQTLAIYYIALSRTPRCAFAAVWGYLAFATLRNPCWWMGRGGGYLWAFPFAIYLMAKLRSRLGSFPALAIGGGCILLCGSLWLIPFIGLSEAFLKGALVFVPSELAKIGAALSLHRWRRT